MREMGFGVRALRDVAPDEARQRLRRSASAIYTDEMRRYARQVLADVARDGDEAVAAYTARWDQVTLSPDELLVSDEAFESARAAAAPDLATAIDEALARARRYNEWVRPPAMTLEELEPGITVGLRYTPFRSVGLYVPSGKGTFPSTLMTMGVPAVVAGVERVVVVVPPRPDGTVDPAVLVVADRLGFREVVRCNGAAGVAAMAVGTARIPQVDTVVGPGNPVVAAIQMGAAAYGARPLVLLGPTESVILADDSADPDLLALDLLNEAEHGPDSAAILLAVDRAVGDQTAAALTRYLAHLPEPRRAYARSALTDLGGLFVVDSLDEALAWIDGYAPEHLQLAVRDALSVASRVRHAGEILVGQHTPFSVANYAIGVPAALPTSGAGFAASGVTVLSFLKTTSIASLTADGLRTLAPLAVRLGAHEGFPAHVLAVTEREALPS